MQVSLMLLQAKLSRRAHDDLCCANTGLRHHPTQFQANYEQWDLLSARPRLDPPKAFAPPPDLLQSAIVPSIGAFGVFHQTSHGAAMFYASADTLQPVGAPTMAYGRLSTTTQPGIRRYRGFVDKPICCCLGTFARSLYELHLETPVVWENAAGALERSDPMASFAGQVLNSYRREADSNLATEVLDLLGESSREEAPIGPIPSLVILKGSATDHDDSSPS